MGNSSSTDASAALLTDLVVVEHIDDNRFGNVAVAKSHTNGTLVYVKDTGLITEAKIEMEIYLSKVKLDKDYFRIFSTLNFAITNKQSSFGYCTQDVNHLIVIFQYFEKTLELEIDQRAQPEMYQPFPEEEIWMMVEALQEMETHFRNNDRIHGDIRLNNIFVSEDGSIKFLDVFLLNWRINGFMKAMLLGARVPLSPESLLKLKQDTPNDEATTQDEIWSIGLVLLCMSSLKREAHFYDWKNKVVNFQNLSLALEDVRKRYSVKLHGLLTRCLQTKPDDRLIFKDFFHLAVSNSSMRINY